VPLSFVSFDQAEEVSDNCLESWVLSGFTEPYALAVISLFNFLPFLRIPFFCFWEPRIRRLEMRKSPNIIVTGTPGVGKTTLCESLAEKGSGKHLSVNQVVKDKECHEGWSNEHQSWIVDEDKVCALKATTDHIFFGD
jgi:Cdc6-like AAA superfamily ATPase